MRSFFEMVMMLAVTGVTNLCMFPAIYSLYRRQFVFEVRLQRFLTPHTSKITDPSHVPDGILALLL
jgi:hypothetical protein